MKKIILFTILSLLFSCNEKKEVEKNEEKKKKSNPIDSSLYSKAFLKDLNDSKFSKDVLLKDKYLLFQNEKIEFPQELKPNIEYQFKGINKKSNYLLKVQRINLTTINYNFILKNNDSLIFKENGVADLGVGFFLASEVDEDSESGTAYGATEYYSTKNNCWLNIRIGVKDEHNKLRARINYRCDNNPKIKELENMPTLRTK